MHSTTCGVGASATNIAALQSTADGLKMGHNNDDAMNKIPLKSASGLDDEEKNGGELMQDTAAAEEARREQMRAKMLAWMKKLTILLICFIGIALISYVFFSLCFSDEPSAEEKQQQQQQQQEKISDHTDGDALQVASIFGDTTGAVSTTPHDALAPAVAASTAPTTPPPVPEEVPEEVPEVQLTADNEPLGTIDNSNEPFNSKLGIYQRAAVCSDKETCSKIGSNILSRNGSAVDAAIAALLCNGLMTMQSLGIGGGMMMNVYVRKNKHAYSIDAREVAPFAAEADMFNMGVSSLVGPLSIAVPGELMGYQRAHERFGKLPWRELVEPSLKICKRGYYMSGHQARALRNKWPKMQNSSIYQSVFLNAETGELLNEGEKVQPPAQLCKTYEMLAENGPLDFYNGTLAKLLVEDLKELGSIISAYDLESYFADLVSSITMQLGDDVLYAMPPVSSGSVVSHVLSILEGYNMTRADWANDTAKALTLHRFVEALKFGFARRPELGDLRFNDVRELVSQLTSPDYGANQRAKIDDQHVLAGPQEYGAQFGSDNDPDGTSNLVVLAPNGDAVSVTSSINAYFGSSLIGPRTGIILNNGMNDFSVENNLFGLPPSASNTIEPRKRAMSSQSPMLLTTSKGDIKLVIGAAGGSRIIPAIVEVVARVLWFGEDIKTAIDAPRFYHQLLPDRLEYEEDSFSASIIDSLKQRGHSLNSIKTISPFGSIVCGIARNATAVYANADFRKRGGIAGF